MTDDFAGIVGPVFHQVLGLLEGFRRGEQPSLDAVHQTLTGAVDSAGRAAAGSSTAAAFEAARYPLVYWIDEVLLAPSCPWRHQAQWKNKILEYHYFKTRKAYDAFWDRADEAVKAREKTGEGDDVLETFFLCVVLGFRGRLRDREPELRAWTSRAASLIRPAVPPADAPPGAPLAWGLRPLKGDRMLVGGSLLVSAAAVAAALAFIAAVHASHG